MSAGQLMKAFRLGEVSADDVVVEMVLGKPQPKWTVEETIEMATNDVSYRSEYGSWEWAQANRRELGPERFEELKGAYLRRFGRFYDEP